MAQTATTTTKKIAADILVVLKTITAIKTGFDYPKVSLDGSLPCVLVFWNGDRNELNTNGTYKTDYTYTARVYKNFRDNKQDWYDAQDLRDSIVDYIHKDRSLSGTVLHMFVTSSEPRIDESQRIFVEFQLQVERIEEYI